MLAQLVNNSYSALQAAYRWYWSEQTQETITELIVITITLLSQAITDYCDLLNSWLTPGCSADVVVIPTRSVEFDPWTELLVDLAYATTWLGFTLGDTRTMVVEYYYRLRTML